MASFDGAIPPGQAGKVNAAIRTDGLSGPVSKVITVTSSDPARPTLALTVRATIVGSVNFFPSRSLFIAGGQPSAGPARTVVRKDDTETGTLALTDVTSSAAWLKVSTRRLEAAEAPAPGLPAVKPGDWIVEATLEGQPPAGMSTAEIRFKTGLPREPEVTVPVTVRVAPELSVSPAHLVLPSPPGPQQPASGVAWITVRQDRDPLGIAASAEPPSFHAELEPAGDRRYKVSVTWLSAGDATPRDGKVTFTLGNAAAVMTVQVAPPPPPSVPATAGTAPTAPTSR